MYKFWLLVNQSWNTLKEPISGCKPSMIDCSFHKLSRYTTRNTFEADQHMLKSQSGIPKPVHGFKCQWRGHWGKNRQTGEELRTLTHSHESAIWREGPKPSFTKFRFIYNSMSFLLLFPLLYTQCAFQHTLKTAGSNNRKVTLCFPL